MNETKRNGVECVVKALGLVAVVLCLTTSAVQSAGVRDRTRPDADANTGISQSQAAELTLTLTEASDRVLQTWIRSAGTLGADGKTLATVLEPSDGALVEVGQRVRAFPVEYRTQMRQGKVTEVIKQDGGILVQTMLMDEKNFDARRYLLEIVVERGPLLSIPNVSIIEENGIQVVYVETAADQYAPRTISSGIQGELYTQILGGLNAGDQVVSIGSFFIDAEHKMKTQGMPSMPGMDHGSMEGMAGMDHGSMAMASNGMPMTEPADNETVNAPVRMIHVMFDHQVDPARSEFEVRTRTGNPIDVGEVMIMGNDGTMLMVMPKTPLVPGDYDVKWHTEGANSEKVEGEFSFTVK